LEEKENSGEKGFSPKISPKEFFSPKISPARPPDQSFRVSWQISKKNII